MIGISEMATLHVRVSFFIQLHILFTEVTAAMLFVYCTLQDYNVVNLGLHVCLQTVVSGITQLR